MCGFNSRLIRRVKHDGALAESNFLVLPPIGLVVSFLLGPAVNLSVFQLSSDCSLAIAL